VDRANTIEQSMILIGDIDMNTDNKHNQGGEGEWSGDKRK
jgi:hypothetical protein